MMFKNLTKKSGQTNSSEYVLVLFLVLAVMSAMTVFFRRAVNARYRDARATMREMVSDRAAPYIETQGSVYEPYYADVNSLIDRSIISRTTLRGASTFPTGEAAKKYFNDTVFVQSVSNVAAPGFAD